MPLPVLEPGAEWVAKHTMAAPRRAILGAASLAFILAYPSLYAWVVGGDAPATGVYVLDGVARAAHITNSATPIVHTLWVWADTGDSVLVPSALARARELQQRFLAQFPNSTVFSGLDLWTDSARITSASQYLGGAHFINGVLRTAQMMKILAVTYGQDALSPVWYAPTVPRYPAWPTWYAFLLLFYLVSWSSFSGLRSRLGLLNAFVVQVVLAHGAAATLARIATGLPAPPVAASWPLFLVGAENLSRLVRAALALPPEQSPRARLAAAMRAAYPTSSVFAAVVTVVPALGAWLCTSPAWLWLRHYLVYLAAGAAISHGLHTWYFSTVLGVDLHRVDFTDVLAEDQGEETPRRPAAPGVAAYLLNASSTQPTPSRWRHMLGQALLLCRLPFFTWQFRHPLSIPFFLANCAKVFLAWRYFGPGNPPACDELGCAIASTDSTALPPRFWASHPLAFVSPVTSWNLAGEVYGQPLPSSSTSYDYLYGLELVLILTFVLAVAAFVMHARIPRDTMEPETVGSYASDSDEGFSERQLPPGHTLDVLKINTLPGLPFVATIGLDHKVLVWLPCADPCPKPFELPIDLWPVVHVAMGGHGDALAVFGQTGRVLLYLRTAMEYRWCAEIPGLVGPPLETFFRKKTVPAFVQRRLESQQSMPRLHFDELIVVTSTGMLYALAADTGALTLTQLAPGPLRAALRLQSVRVNDRIICQLVNGEVMVATAVNNAWKCRRLVVVEEKYNKGMLLMTPAALSRTNLRFQPFQEGLPRSPSAPPSTEVSLPPLAHTLVAAVPFVGMMVRTATATAELIDVQTGTLVKRFGIGDFVPGTFRVFHLEPQHCRFCGCALVSSFSLVYTEAATSTVIMHTFSVERRAKNSICLRVERDPRERRCLGFDAVTEQLHWLPGVECWNLTDMNMIMGVMQRPERVEESGTRTSGRLMATLIARRKLEALRLWYPAAVRGDVWEGFTMTASGQVRYHRIPAFSSGSRPLLVSHVRQAERFGHKSLVVGFGNVVKVLYVGADGELMRQDEVRAELATRGLSFVSKRRRRRRAVSVDFAGMS